MEGKGIPSCKRLGPQIKEKQRRRKSQNMRVASLIPFCCPPPPIMTTDRSSGESQMKPMAMFQVRPPTGIVFTIAPRRADVPFLFTIENSIEWRWTLEPLDCPFPITFTVNKVHYGDVVLPWDVTRSVITGLNQISFQSVNFSRPVVVEISRKPHIISVSEYLSHTSPTKVNSETQQKKEGGSYIYAEEPLSGQQHISDIFHDIRDSNLDFGFDDLFMPK
jgi:hypothetical protein